jgi:hypothetical protein
VRQDTKLRGLNRFRDSRSTLVTGVGVSSGLEVGFYLLKELFGDQLAIAADKIKYKN